MKIKILVLGLSLAITPALYAQNTGTSNATTPTAMQNDVIYGTGLTADELRQHQYTDQEIAQLRTDGQVLMAQNKVNPMPQSDVTTASDQGGVVPGTGLTAAELKKWNYSDQEIAQLRNDGQTLMAQNSGGTTPGTASGNADQSSTAAPTPDRTGLWGLLGLLGLLGFAGRGRRREVVRQDVDVIDRDRVVERDRDRRIA